MQSELLTLAEVARRLNVHRGTVARWAREGEIPSLKIGGTVRIRADVIDDFLESAKQEAS